MQKINNGLAAVVVRRPLGRLQTGANVYLCALIDELRDAGFVVHLVFASESTFGDRPFLRVGAGFLRRCDGVHWSRTLRLGQVFVSLSPRVHGRFLRRVVGEVMARLTGSKPQRRPGRVSQRLPAAEAGQLARSVDAIAPDLAIVEYSALGPVLDRVRAPGARKAILLHDLFSLRAQAMRDRDLPVDVADFTIEEEAALCASAHMLIYASHTERAAFQILLPERDHVWLPPSYGPPAQVPPSGHPRALFLGVRHVGNQDAVAFLMTEIWPRVVAQRPEAELYIVGEIGSFLDPAWVELPGVKVLGIVEDLSTLGGPDTIGLAPTRVGSGISIKVADYLKLGMTVVASRAALDGYGCTLDRSVQLAETADEFAESIVDLLDRGGGEAPLSGHDYCDKNELRNLLKTGF